MGGASARIFSKFRGIFDIRRPVTTSADQGTGQWEREMDLWSAMQIYWKSTSEDQGN